MSTKVVGMKSLVVIDGREYVVEGVRVSGSNNRVVAVDSFVASSANAPFDSYEYSPKYEFSNYEDADLVDEESEREYYDCHD